MSANNEVKPVSEPEDQSFSSTKEAWWAGYRAGKGLPADMPRQEAVRAEINASTLAQPVPEPFGYVGEDDIAEIKTYSPAIIAIYSEQHEPTDKPVYLSPIPSDLLTRTIAALEIGDKCMHDVDIVSGKDSRFLKSVLADLRKIGGTQ